MNSKFLSLIMLWPCISWAGAQTDGTMGATTTLSGHFEVPQALGTLVGNNLFHSFKSFSIERAESATFTGAASIQNVISRVTGGEISRIDGLLRSQIGQAAFYFINPAGVFFNENAQIDVPAAFHVSTADHLNFADGSQLNTRESGISQLSIERPEAYGFAGDRSAEIRFEGNGGWDDQLNWHGSQITVKPGSMLDITGGTINLIGMQLAAPEGIARLVAVGPQTEDIFIGELPNQPLSGDIQLNQGFVNVSGNGAGLLALRGRNVSALFSHLLANNHGDSSAGSALGVDIRLGSLKFIEGGITSDAREGNGNAGEIKVKIHGNLELLNGATISSDTYHKGKAGNISIEADSINIDAQGKEGLAGISSNAEPNSLGDAGNLNLTINGFLQLLNGGFISSDTYAQGKAGNISVEAHTMRINGQDGVITALSSDAYPNSTGNAGTLAINVHNLLTLENGGFISSDTYAQGKAGTISVTAGSLTINGNGLGELAGVSSNAEPNSTGSAGTLNFRIQDRLKLLNGGFISSDTYSEGNAGNIKVVAGEMTIEGQGGEEQAGISSNAEQYSTGDAGTLTLNVQNQLNLMNGGFISSDTNGLGKAGSITLKAGSVTIYGLGDSEFFSGLSSRAILGSSGQPGDVSVNAQESLTILNGGQISINNEAEVTTPHTIQSTGIHIKAPSLTLYNTPEAITAAATGNVSASDIDINSQLLDIHNAGITTNSQAGNGGNIDVRSPVLVLDTGFIQANTNGEGGNGGRVTIQTDALIPSASHLLAGGKFSWPFKPGIPGYNVIQAAAPSGLSGTVAVSTPLLDLSGNLLGLKNSSIDTHQLIEDFCALNVRSSLQRAGFGALPKRARDTLD